MHTGKSYSLSEFLFWTRKSILWLLLLGTLPTVLYEVFDLKWLSLPWPVVALIGTATAFIVGFKNVQTYNRTWEARTVWGAAMGASRAWATMCRDFFDNPQKSKELIYRHLAWLTALRYQLRTPRAWETIIKGHNAEYMASYSIPEAETPLEVELAKYIPADEVQYVLSSKNVSGQLLNLQSKTLKELYETGLVDNYRFMDMHGAMREFFSHQGKSERIKNFPYPRQYATINKFFVNLFCFLLPFAMLGEFEKFNEDITGFLKGNAVWLVIPFSVLISWVYISLEQVGESTENPFEGNANDVPISQMSRAVEIDLREMLGEKDLPTALQPKNNIIL
jgi:putative membrane protein